MMGSEEDLGLAEDKWRAGLEEGDGLEEDDGPEENGAQLKICCKVEMSTLAVVH